MLFRRLRGGCDANADGVSGAGEPSPAAAAASARAPGRRAARAALISAARARKALRRVSLSAWCLVMVNCRARFMICRDRGG